MSACVISRFTAWGHGFLFSGRLLDDKITRAAAPVGVIMPVMPYGLPLDIAAGQQFRWRTGAAVLANLLCKRDWNLSLSEYILLRKLMRWSNISSERRIMTVDISVDLGIKENTNLPYDGHPSAIANQQYARKLDLFLCNKSLVRRMEYP